MLNLLSNQENFFKTNQHFFVLAIAICAFVILVFCVFTFIKSSKLTKSMLVNKFKVIDMNQKNALEDAPLYTIAVFNNSMNTISISAIGFVHDGNFFNFRSECKAQLADKNSNLVITPRGSITLRLYKAQLEYPVFKLAKTKRLKKIKVFIIGQSGERFMGKAKVISKKMSLSYKEYYRYNQPEICARFVASCNHKKSAGIKLTLAEKIKCKILSKRVVGALPEVCSPQEEYQKQTDFTVKEETFVPNAIKDCEIENPKVELPENALEKTKTEEVIIPDDADEIALSSYDTPSFTDELDALDDTATTDSLDSQLNAQDEQTDINSDY